MISIKEARPMIFLSAGQASFRVWEKEKISYSFNFKI